MSKKSTSKKSLSKKQSKFQPQRITIKNLIPVFIIVFIIAGICLLAYNYEMGRGHSDVNTAGNFEDALFTEAYYTFKEGYGSSYSFFYEPTYKYLNLFGRDALSAYFYGYDEFFEKNGGKTFKLEHDAFVVSLAYYDKAQDGIICTEGIYNAWNARF